MTGGRGAKRGADCVPEGWGVLLPGQEGASQLGLPGKCARPPNRNDHAMWLTLPKRVDYAHCP